MIFRDAHATSAVCTPSRYNILTGRYSWWSSLKQRVSWGYSTALIEPERMMVASYLKEQGYNTASIGKWHLGWEWGKQIGATDYDESSVDTPPPQDFWQGNGANSPYKKPPSTLQYP